jgi:protein-S-isoprenylcysteine O-methyltransferase Ste14
MLHLIVALGGGLVFVGSLVYFVVSYAWRFEGDASAPGPLGPAAANIALFSLFALHHSAFARSGAKTWVQQRLPPVLERSLYVWVASLLFVLTCALWLPVSGLAWRATGPLRPALWTIQLGAAVFTVWSARRLGLLRLAGVTHVLESHTRAGPATSGPTELDESGPYGIVRHPIYLGWLLMVWAAPTMNGTRLVFAIVSTAYLALAVPFEERDLRASFGAAYERYSRRVKWRMIPFLY